MQASHFLNRCFSTSRCSRRIIFQNNFKYGNSTEVEKTERNNETRKPEKRATARLSRGEDPVMRQSRENAWWNNNGKLRKGNRPPMMDTENSNLQKEALNDDWTYLRYSKNKKNKRKMCPELDLIRDLDRDNEVLFGYHPLLLALQAKRRTVHRVFYRKGIEEGNKINLVISKCVLDNIEVYPCDIQTLDRLSDGRPHQGICAVVSKLEPLTLTEGPDEQQSSCLWLLLNRIHDPMNFGAILRSAYFLGVDKIVTGSEGSCRLSPVVSKASAGALELEPVFAVSDLAAFLQDRKAWNIWGATGSCDDVSPIDVRHCSVNKPTILVIGNEGEGIQMELRPLVQRWVQVSSGRQLECGIDSLNVGAATAILIHALTNNRK